MFTKTVSVKLSAPIKWEDREISVIDLDFGKVSGKILRKCEQQTQGNMTAALRPLSLDYTSSFASMISDIPLKAIEKLNYEDFDLVCRVVQNYLLKEDPQEYYDDYVKENMGFTNPAALPESQEKMEQVGSTTIS